jgi:beta-glucosidase
MGLGERFPDGFVWGTATAAHQIEGGNVANDWWAFEHAPDSGVAEPSGDACDSWHRWPEDVDLVERLGLDSYRFSIEWSRIEPEPGEFSAAALDHYRRLCGTLRERGVDPVVTFHHFTTPRWLVDQGGWEASGGLAADAFGRFCEKAAAALGDVITRACTLNEPNIVAAHGWAIGNFPPGKVDSPKVLEVMEHFIAAHRSAVAAIRGAAPGLPVGMTLAMVDWIAVDGGEATRDLYRQYSEDIFLAATEGDDFIGVQAYTRNVVGPEGMREPTPEPGRPAIAMGYDYWPQALEATVRRAWEMTDGKVPIIVTENGIGTDDDALRIRYVHDALDGLLRAIADGIDVRGYTLWSLLDNFEWADGYRPKFGLVAVDPTTFARTPKPSAAWFGSVAQSNSLQPVPGA